MFFSVIVFENMATGTHNRVFWWQVLGPPQRGAVNGTPFLSFFQCDCFENMATGTHNRVFCWQVLGPPRGVPLTAPLFSRFFSVIVLRIWQQVRTIGFSGGRCWGLPEGCR